MGLVARNKSCLLLGCSEELAESCRKDGAAEVLLVRENWQACNATHHLHSRITSFASVFMPIFGYLQSVPPGKWDLIVIDATAFDPHTLGRYREIAYERVRFGGEVVVLNEVGVQAGVATYPRKPGFLISSYPRCGTHMLLTSLDSHPSLTVFGEVFNKDSDNGAHGFKTTPQVLEAFWRNPYCGIAAHAYLGRSRAGTQGAPGLGGQTPYPDFWQSLPRDTKVISLRRRDLRARHISHLRAKATGQWNAFRGEDVKNVSVTVNEATLQRDEAFIKRCWGLVDTLYPDRLVVWYEDMCEHWEREQQRIQQYLGVSYVSVAPSSKKLAAV